MRFFPEPPLIAIWKLDDVVPIDNRPSPPTIHTTFSRKKLREKIWHHIAEYAGYVTNQVRDKYTDDQFNSPGHSLSGMQVSVIERIKIKWTEYKEGREHIFIRTFYKGMNRQNWYGGGGWRDLGGVLLVALVALKVPYKKHPETESSKYPVFLLSIDSLMAQGTYCH